MIKSAAQVLKENYNRLGELTDAQFLAAKAKACDKKLIHAERIVDITRIANGVSESIKLSDINEGDSIRIKATVRSMLGGVEKTGYVALKNIQDVHHDDHVGMLIVDSDGLILTTIDCKEAMQQLNDVLRGDNWVNQQSLSDLIGSETTLKDFQHIRDGGYELELDGIVFDEPQTPDLLF